MFPHHTASTADKQSVDVAREAFLAGETLELPGLRPEVRSAWVRSRAAGVDPELKHVPLLLEGPELHEYQRTHDIYRAGRHAARAAAALLKNTGCAIVLTDASGLVLYTDGDRSMLRHAERVGSLPGASWREDLVGNNAVGTSLVVRRPVQFCAAEHWSAGWIDWACFAAPIRAPSSETVLGTVALVTRSSQVDEAMLPWVTEVAGTLAAQVGQMHAAQIALLQARTAQLRRWFPDSGLLALTPQGRVVWTAGPVPPGLLEQLAQEVFPAGWGDRPEEREVALADGTRCLSIPLHQGAEVLGHVVLVPARSEPDAAPHTPPALHKLVAWRDGRAVLFDPRDVLALSAEDGRVHILTDSGRWPTPYRSVREVARQLPDGTFFQTDRGTLVNLSRVREIHPMFNRTATLIMADRHRTAIPVSRRRTAALRRLLRF